MNWTGQVQGALLVLATMATGCIAPAKLAMQPLGKDQELGQEVSQTVEQEIGLYRDPGVSVYINTIGQRLLQHLSPAGFYYKFQLVDQAAPNAFAAPGGAIFISRGMLAMANSESEIANIIGHEIIHVERRHTAKQLAKQRFPNLLALPGRAVGVVNEDLGQMLISPIENIESLYLADYSRQHEKQADRLGQRLSARAGYDPAALTDVLVRLAQEAEMRFGKKEEPQSWINTHPSTPQRVEDARRRAAKMAGPAGPTASEKSRFRANHLRRLEGLLVGPNPSLGLLIDQNFLHPNLDLFMAFPAGWDTLNTRRKVVSIAPDGEGLLLFGVRAQGHDPEAMGRQLIETIEREVKIKPTRAERVTTGAWPGYLVSFSDNTGPQPLNLHLLWVASRGWIYQLVGLAVDRHQTAMRDAALSLRPLTPKERESIQETRIHIAAARQGESLSDLTKRTGNAWSPRATALLNGLAEDQPLPEGRLVKIATRHVFLP